MSEERPVVFTISQGEVLFKITTKDPRGKEYRQTNVSHSGILRTMFHISTALNEKGYAVLFEVE